MSPKLSDLKSALFDREYGVFEPGRTLVGLDIGTRNVKVAALKATPVGTRLVGLGLAEIPQELLEEAIEPGIDMVKRAQVEAIKGALSSSKARSKRVVANIFKPSVTVNDIVLPHMPEVELNEAIRWEIEQSISFPINEAVIDYLVCGEVMRTGVKGMEVEVVAVKRKEAEEPIAPISEAGLKVQSLNIEPYSLWNSFQKVGRRREDEAIALIDIGASSTKINIFSDNALRFRREIPLAGDTLTGAIQKGLNLNFLEAEKLKEEDGANEFSSTFPIVSPFLKEFSMEIERSFGYYKAQSHRERIDKVILYGGGAKLKDIDRYLTDKLGTVVEVGNPFDGILFDVKDFEDMNTEDVAPMFGVAIGLASTGEAARSINLLPQEMRIERKVSFKETMIKLGVGLLIFALLSSYLNLRFKEINYRKRKARMEAVLSAWKTKGKLERKDEFIRGIRERQKLWSGVLTQITEAIPEDVWLSRLSILGKGERRSVKIFGYSHSVLFINKFILQLEKWPHFKEVKLEFARTLETKEEIINFEILCVVK